jgi:hypothetical protein
MGIREEDRFRRLRAERAGNAGVALAAHTGDKVARKRLDEINALVTTHASELASIDAALRAAGERVVTARAAAEREAAKANAAEIRKLLLRSPPPQPTSMVHWRISSPPHSSCATR